MEKRFAVCKGLQKPIIFRGFKGKFIYWGIASLLSGLTLGALVMSLVNMWLGGVVLLASIPGGLSYIAAKQKNGLHDKTVSKGVYIHQANLKHLKNYGQKASV